MLKNLISASTKFYEDQALIFLTFGGFGRYVLSILHSEFNRLGIPKDKVNFLAFDTEKPHRDRLNLNQESEYFIHLDQFDGDVYIDSKENSELKKSVDHVPTKLFCDIESGCKGVPAVGFVSFHKYDDMVISRQALNLVDTVRSKNPGKKIKLIMISGMGGSVSNGMSIPFLYRMQNRLKEKRVRVEVYLATSEGYLGLQNVQEQGVERNCVASSMLWEHALAGKNGLVYPGKNGVRDHKMFSGKIAHRMYIFSGGSAETSLKYQAIASTIAQSIATLELTKVGSYLDGDRVNYAAHILEREWAGKKGNMHTTGLMTMNVAGLKGDCIPQLYHLHMVRQFIEDISRPINVENKEMIKSKGLSSFLENNLNEDELLSLFKITIPGLTRETINSEHVSEEKIYPFLLEEVEKLRDNSLEVNEKKNKMEEAGLFIKKVQDSFLKKGKELQCAPESYLKGALLFYEKLTALMEKKIEGVNESISKIEKDLFEGSNQKKVNTLLEKLASVSGGSTKIGGFIKRLGQPSVQELVNQIIDTTARIRQQKTEKYNHLLLQEIYNALHSFLVLQQEECKKTIFQYNKMNSEVEREAATIKRVGRSAFTYSEVLFDKLSKHLLEKMYTSLENVSTQKVIEELGGIEPQSGNVGDKEYVENLLKIIHPEPHNLASFVDTCFCEDNEVYNYIQTMLSQFFMTLKLDRDRFPALETSTSRFVICTAKFYEKYKDDLFEGYSHIETEDPFNVLVTMHEEGFPFISISYMNRINETFKELQSHDKSSLGHIMAELDEKLPLLDS